MYNILLVEDDAVIREAFAIILALNQSYTITTAENGQIAIDLCRVNTYDLILLDIMMPVLDGVGFLKEYTDHYHDAGTKVVIMSNLSSGSELSIVQDFGVEKSVLKSSLTPTKLIELVGNILRNSEQSTDIT